MREKFYNDGLVGNEKVKASFSKTGELLRLFYGSPDYKQFLETFHVGLKINESALVYLHNDINNVFSQEYVKDSNVLQTYIHNTYFNVKIEESTFVPMTEDVLIRNYKIRNENSIDLKIDFLAYSKMYTNVNDETAAYVKKDALIQYIHDFAVCTFSNNKISSKQLHGAEKNFMQGSIWGKDYIGISPDSAISYDLGKIKAGESVEFTLYMYVNRNKEKNLLNEVDDEIERIRSLDVKKLQDDTVKYWRKFIKDHDELGINKKDISEKIKKIYNRSILLFPMLLNRRTGGISAGIEIDEYKTRCGRYSYCWPRDGVFVTEALDTVGMHEDAEKFYSVFSKITQNKNGSWEQRFYTDGRLTSGWGYQIDETSSVVFGLYAHYKVCKSKKFLKDNLKMCENAIAFLETYLDDLLGGKGKFQLSYDLWEEFEGTTLYSISSIFAAFSSMIRIYTELSDTLKTKQAYMKARIDELEAKKAIIKDYCLKTFYDESKKSFVRNTIDKRSDISILGAIIPFRMFSPIDKEVVNTIERLNMTIRTYTGGYLRYEQDNYMNGNPWPIATLWMAWYYLEVGENKKALECLSFVINSASNHGFIGEQVDNATMQPTWVIGLTWSHAMFILTLEKLLEKGLI